VVYNSLKNIKHLGEKSTKDVLGFFREIRKSYGNTLEKLYSNGKL
jgi:hypothetical protein